ALIYTAGQTAPALDFTNWKTANIASPVNPFRPAQTLAVHIWKINSEGIQTDPVAVCAGASAVLVIAVMVFKVGARYLG
ncbi:phosphate ABC transporter, permease protein PstA, partial [Lacticaseibacillus rhamnosus]